MPFVKKLIRLGGSSAVVIDKPIMRQLDLEPDGEVEVRVENDAVIITPHRYASDAEFRTATDRIFGKRRRLMERLAKK